MWKIIYYLIKIIPKGDVCNGWRKVVYATVKMVPKCNVCNGWAGGDGGDNLLIDKFSEFDMSERRE